jgi:predicted nucleotidyltransferase
VLVETAHPTRVILFGSQARGSASADSDADLLVVKPEVRDVLEENFQLRLKLMPLCLPMDLILTSQSRFDQWRNVPGTVFHDAAREGRVLYEAA